MKVISFAGLLSLLTTSSLAADLKFNSLYRTYDGSYNNLKSTSLGSAGSFYSRNGYPAQYSSVSKGTPINGPDARLISNTISDNGQTPSSFAVDLDDGIFLSQDHGNLFEVFFGQFVNHDLEDNDFYLGPIPYSNISTSDVFYGNPFLNLINTTVLAIQRSVGSTDASGVFQIFNEGNSWLDLSPVYGLNHTVNAALRTGSGGLMKTASYHGITGGIWNPTLNVSVTNLPPPESSVPQAPFTDFNMDLLFFDPTTDPVAGDHRAAENTNLLAIHAIFLRRHNYHATKIAKNSPSLSDELTFQLAREVTIAEYQHIIFDEYLPFLTQSSLPAYNGYQSSVDPRTTLPFATAAFRYGHSALRNYDVVDACHGSPVSLYNGNTHPVGLLPNSYFPTSRIVSGGITFVGPSDDISLYPTRALGLYVGNTTYDAVDNVIRSLLATQAADVDILFTNFFRSAPGPVDVFSQDIYRGRLNGLPSYYDVLQKERNMDLYSKSGCSSGSSIDSIGCFNAITSNSTLAQNLQTLYRKVNKIDLLVGLLSEDKTSGAHLPPTISQIILNEYQRKRDADRFYYENILSPADVAKVKNVNFADLIASVTGFASLPVDIFVVPSPNDVTYNC